MKYVLPILFSLPTALILFLFIVGPFLDFAPANETQQWPPRPSSLPAVFVFLTFLGFAASVAMVFVKPDAREWKIASIFTGLPIVLLMMIFGFFEIIGYNG